MNARTEVVDAAGVDAAGVGAAVRRTGHGVVRGVLGADDVRRSVTALAEVFAAEDDIAEARRWLTHSHRVAYMLPAKHPWFLAWCRPGPLVEIAGSLLGSDCVIAAFNGLDMRSGGAPQPLHRDHPVVTPGVPLYVHAVVALDPFTAATGATRLVPGSHLDPGDPPYDDLEAATVQPELAPGDAVVYDATCIHGGSANRTTRPRRALHVLFARRWVQPLWDFPGSIRDEDAIDLDDERRRLLGYGNTPARYDHEARRSFGYGWG